MISGQRYAILTMFLLDVHACTAVDYLHMPEHLLARCKALTTDLTSPASSSRVPSQPGLAVLNLLLQQLLHPLLQLGFQHWLMELLAEVLLWQGDLAVSDVTMFWSTLRLGPGLSTASGSRQWSSLQSKEIPLH